ncbi:hypothetical protein [Rubrivirga sp. IMCC43871]|uniref:hypothetical protein n=1 Tax=Rubrivirga sp. IMCC43871 TaxID=3391575 RepID=UPI0039901C3E
MRGRPPKKTLTAEQEHAASAFVEAAEAPDSGSGREASSGVETASRVVRQSPVGEERPWEAAYVREDVTKGYALRLPEPLYLKLKWMADQTGRSMNTVVREVVEADVEAFLAREKR